MPKLRSKRSAKQLNQLSEAQLKRESTVQCENHEVVEVESIADDDDNDFEQELLFQSEDVSSSSDLANHNDPYYNDSGNEEVEETLEAQTQYVPHALIFERKHSMVIALVEGIATLVPYNGDDIQLYQIVGVPYVQQNHSDTITIGYTSYRNIKGWAMKAEKNALSGIQHPRLTGTAGCRSVRDSILATNTMASHCVFPFFLYVRTSVLANKVKGIVRRAAKPEYVMNAPDCTGAFTNLMPYILQKIVGESFRLF